MPLFVAEEKGKQALAGAVVVLKSARRVGMHFSALHAVEVGGFEHLQAESQKMKEVLAQAAKLAMQDAPLLIVGETGTGKELLARACHGASLRSSHPFMALNCAAMPDNVAESELFGYAPGAFGNNTEGKRGVLELASGGTLMLDEIGDMSPHLQTKFLRVLQDGVFRRVGDEQEVKVNVRFICTTQKQLLDLVHEGKFREDLYYRLNVLSLAAAAARARRTSWRWPSSSCPALPANCSAHAALYPQHGRVPHRLPLAGQRAPAAQLPLPGHDPAGRGRDRPEHVDLPVAADAMPLIDEWFEGGLDEAVKRFESRLLERLYPAFPPPASWPSGSVSPIPPSPTSCANRDWQEVVSMDGVPGALSALLARLRRPVTQPCHLPLGLATRLVSSVRCHQALSSWASGCRRRRVLLAGTMQMFCYLRLLTGWRHCAAC
jgi:transcriptional regulator of aroF, aroG, tyrA and aromatic amino acid transport